MKPVFRWTILAITLFEAGSLAASIKGKFIYCLEYHCSHLTRMSDVHTSSSRLSFQSGSRMPWLLTNLRARHCRELVSALHWFLKDYQQWQHGSCCSWQYSGYLTHQECSVAASVAGLDDSADVTRCDLLPQTHVKDEEVSSYKNEERVRQHDYKGT